eukprot:CAMPEP_0195265310 /NCGR_PEP_ID=MMETSP0706-20130129/11345_1 /TAXON_ID=33640 /ORGANISM="Asterionellopsis glacialis, Strain CCMP134" /LENGTH=179 /DNA_ID=CAMNT_0040319699 /DNA_START=82 /DNA_END=621 /DNA_ORIENTATION=-
MAGQHMSAEAFSVSMKADGPATRRTFFSNAAASAAAVVAVTSVPSTAAATPEIYNTEKGVKYAILKQPKDPKKAAYPQQNDIVAVEYTGYLVDGKIFDATHGEGKGNALLWQLGTEAVIPGLNDIVAQMVVGQKVQAIIPPAMAFGDKGICIEGGDCLVKPGSTLVYDVFLKKTSIPPP